MTLQPSSDNDQSRIALVGRPNVGKSTLFNRLIGSRKAVECALRGTTRDRLYGRVDWRGVPLILIDTGGAEFGKQAGLAGAVQRQIQDALSEADRVVLVCDAQTGLLPADQMMMEWLRKIGKPVIVAVNKMDGPPVVSPEFFSLGVDDVLPVSALHGRGTGDLLDRMVKGLRERPADRSGERVPTVAILGRQNVGKSSLVNALVRAERMIVSDVPGTTRDAIDLRLEADGDAMIIIDTAGLRHRRKVSSPVDFFAMSRSLGALQRCDIALIVLDASAGITQDDRRLITQVCEAGRGMIIVLNKWDLVSGGDARRVAERTRQHIPAVAFAPIIAVSAKTGFHISSVVQLIQRVWKAWGRGLSEDELGGIMRNAWAARAVPRLRGRAVELHGVRWIPGRPARAELFTHPAGLPEAYQHYLLKVLRAQPRLLGIPVRIVVSATRGPGAGVKTPMWARGASRAEPLPAHVGASGQEAGVPGRRTGRSPTSHGVSSSAQGKRHHSCRPWRKSRGRV